MGQAQTGGDESLREEAKQASALFESAELRVLKQTFKDLALRSPGKTVDKDTFLRFMPLPGIMGERLFAQFDRKQTGVIDYEEFICGLAVTSRGSRQQKLEFIFQLYDLTGDNSVSRAELATLLNQVPRSTMQMLGVDVNAAAAEAGGSEHGAAAGMVEQAFAECDLNRDGRLSFEQFCMWVERTPMVERFLDQVLPYSSSPSADGGPGTPTSSVDGVASAGAAVAAAASRGGLPEGAAEQLAGEAETRALLVQARDRTALPAIRAELAALIQRLDDVMAGGGGGDGGGGQARGDDMEGMLWKKGRSLRQFTERWALLRNRHLFFFTAPGDQAPRSVMFLSGCHVAATEAERGYFGFEIVVVVGHERTRKVLFAKTAGDRDRWVAALRAASAVVPVEDDYELGEPLGEGRFSQVHACRHRATGIEYAVKVITKAEIAPSDKELLRTEIAILKLVSHRNIVRLVDVYEGVEHIHIVMELLTGGELFDRIVGRARYSEAEARAVIRPILDAVTYLHAMGIVHRDLKPENILCGAEPGQLKIADFGLSKLVSPDEVMSMPCGTLSYVAPEVLMLNGYGREADAWSVGVIMYLLLRGKLPFDGKTKNEIIDKTVNGPLNIDGDSVWQALSADARDLVSRLLAKNPADRPTAAQALQHPWLMSGDEGSGSGEES